MPTSRESKGSSRKAKVRTGDFDRSVWNKAAAIAADYRLILEQDERLGFIGTAIEMPTVFADGRTPDACVRALRQALCVAVAAMLEDGRRPPTSAKKRSVQVNIRLTPDEKLALEEAASRMGFKGLSDYVRHAALSRQNA